MPPGITGWAQVNGRASLPWSERIELDIWYVEHRSLWLDLKILALTVRMVLGGHGLYHADESGGVDLGPQRPGRVGSPPWNHGAADLRRRWLWARGRVLGRARAVAGPWASRSSRFIDDNAAAAGAQRPARADARRRPRSHPRRGVLATVGDPRLRERLIAQGG